MDIKYAYKMCGSLVLITHQKFSKDKEMTWVFHQGPGNYQLYCQTILQTYSLIETEL